MQGLGSRLQKVYNVVEEVEERRVPLPFWGESELVHKAHKHRRKPAATSKETEKAFNSGRWSKTEREDFARAVDACGGNWDQVAALRDFQGTEEPSGELELDQNLQKKLAQVLSPFTKDGRIVLTRELAVLGAYRILRMGSGEEGQQMHEPKTIPIPSLRPEMKPEPEPRYWVEEAVVDVEAQEEWRGNEAEAHSQCGPASSPNSCIY